MGCGAAAGRCLGGWRRTSSWRTRRLRAAENSAAPVGEEDAALRALAREALRLHAPPHGVVGLAGSGALTAAVVAEAASRGDVSLMPCGSIVAATEAAVAGVRIANAGDAKPSAVLVEADELDAAADGLPFVFGRAAVPIQPDIARLRAALEAGPPCVALVPPGAVVDSLGGSVPIVIPSDDWEAVAEELDDVFLGDAEIWRRPASGSDANPRGGPNPYVSAEGTTIVDVRFTEAYTGERIPEGLRLFGKKATAAEVAAQIESVDGVVCHGLLFAQAALAAGPEGVVELKVDKKERL